MSETLSYFDSSNSTSWITKNEGVYTTVSLRYQVENWHISTFTSLQIPYLSPSPNVPSRTKPKIAASPFCWLGSFVTRGVHSADTLNLSLFIPATTSNWALWYNIKTRVWKRHTMPSYKLYSNRTANPIMAKLTNYLSSTDQTYNTIDWQILFTWLWRLLPLKSLKSQS